MAENWSISKHFNNLVTDSKMFFSSKIRTIAFIILSLVILTGLFYFNSHPLMGQTPTNSGSINMSNYDYSKTTSDRLVTGPDGVPEITILMFTDYECHFCGISSKEVKKLLVANPDIRLIFKDYPLDQSCNQRVGRPFHKFACEASISSRCAAEQGKFWEYHDLVFDNQNNLDPTSLQVYAEELKLNMDQFNSCVNNKKPLNKIITDIDEGAALGVSGTPTLFIEGKKIEGFRTFEELQKEIDTIKAEIQKQKEEYEKQKQEYLKQKAQQETQKNQAQNQNTNKQNNQE